MGTSDGFEFADEGDEVIVRMPIGAGIKAKDLLYKLTPSSLTLGIKVPSPSYTLKPRLRVKKPRARIFTCGRQGEEAVLDGEFWGGNKVKVDDSNWEIENAGHLGRCCVVTLMSVSVLTVVTA